MAATGRMQSRKGEATAYEEGDIYGAAIGGEEEEDYARGLEQFDRESAEAHRLRKQQAYMRSKQQSKEKEEAEYRRLKELGLLGVAADTTGGEEIEKKRKRINKQLAEDERAKLREEIEQRKRERLEKSKWLKSAEYKRQQWELRVAEGKAYMEQWDVKEAEHRGKADAHQAIKDQMERQKKVDLKHQQSASGGASATSAASATPTPKPKAGGKAGGKKGGKKVDLSRYAGVQLPNAVKQQEQKELDDITFDPARDKDPARPEEEKLADGKEWERKEREWRKYMEEWIKIKEDHRKELERLKGLGALEEEQPTFEDESASESESESESESDESDKSDDDWN